MPMDVKSNAPYYKARTVNLPVRRIDGTVIVKVEYCDEPNRRTIASFYSDQERAQELKIGTEIYVCPFDGDAYIDEKKNKKH